MLMAPAAPGADGDIDAIMQRTRKRPIPAGRVDPQEAVSFGIVLAIGAVTLMALAVNWLAAGLLALTIAFYVFVYTMWLKRRTPQNIVIGGAAGAFPPMIGWAAVTGEISLASIALFLLIFMWTPPPFLQLGARPLSHRRLRQGRRAHAAGGGGGARHQGADAGLHRPAVPARAGAVGARPDRAVYAAAAVLLGLLFILAAVRVWFDSGSGRRGRCSPSRSSTSSCCSPS